MGGVGDFWISVRMMGFGVEKVYIDVLVCSFTWGIIGHWLCYLLMSD